jgi:hypothetical protein
MLGDKISSDLKYTEKVKFKRSTKVIFLKFSYKKLNMFLDIVDH